MKHFLCVIAVLSLLLCGCDEENTVTSKNTTSPETTLSTTAPTTAPTGATVPEENFLEVMREGEVSQIPAVMVQTCTEGVTLAIDPAYFVHKSEEGLDEFIYETWGGSQPVYYSIGVYVEGSPSFEEQMLEDHGAKFASHSFSETEIAGYPAKEAVFVGLLEDPTYCHHVYLLDCGDIKYQIDMQFVIEMYEGLYPIIMASLNTLQITA